MANDRATNQQKEEKATKEEAQEIINEESTKSEADGTPCSYEEGDLTE